MKVGALHQGNGEWLFRVWAPFAKKVELALTAERSAKTMAKTDRGYWERETALHPGSRYSFRIDGGPERGDPASGFQPGGVHGPSETVDHSSFAWDDRGFEPVPLHDMVIYELHVGAFTPEGTFARAIERLPALRDLGVSAIELMPVAQFPGSRNWGYDGVFPYAPQNSYGGPEGMKMFVNACHLAGISVVLDVVYNHLGPEGNYLEGFGPYFTDKYRTFWGKAINFDGPWSDEVRAFFIGNAFHWFDNYHVDGLRLDAVHAIFDTSAKPFLEELAEAVDGYPAASGRRRLLIAESDLNDARVIRRREDHGFGIHAQWCDDFHHALHVAVTGERTGYYGDFGGVDRLAKSLRSGFVYTGQHSGYRNRRHGNTTDGIEAGRFVVFSQNHDQVGNRALGDRLSTIVSFEALKLAAGAVILSPFVPLLFMGEEYGEEAPFLYFTSHGDPQLAQAVREGRAREFELFDWKETPPDPQDEATFGRSKLRWEGRSEGAHRVLLEFHRELLRLRRENLALGVHGDGSFTAESDERTRSLRTRRRSTSSEFLMVMNFGEGELACSLPSSEKGWKAVFDSSDRRWRGPGSAVPTVVEPETAVTVQPLSFVLFSRDGGPHP